jgi:type VI secretion system protein ImpH
MAGHRIRAAAPHSRSPAFSSDLDPLRLLPLAGLLAQHARSAAVVRRVVADYFAVPVAVEEWVKRMAPIPDDQQFRFGAPWLALGSTTVLGEAVPDAAGAVTIVLGPLSPREFEDFLPGGAARPSLHALLRLVVREPVECLVDLVMAGDVAAGLVLGGGRLGWTTWQDAPGAARRCPTGPA